MAAISPELDALACALIGYAIEALEADQLCPTVALDCEQAFVSFSEDTPDNCYRQACEYVAAAGAAASRYAIVADGFVQADETAEAQPAILVEFGERGMENAWSGHLFYMREGEEILVTDPQPAGAEPLLLS